MSNVSFSYIESSDEDLSVIMEIRKKHLKDVSQFGDNHYLSLIFNHLSDLYNGLSEADLRKLQSQKEEDITDSLKKILENNCQYDGFIVNSEARNQSEIVGYYDLKIQHSDWYNYFVLECKKLTNKNDKIDAYIHNKIDGAKDDGGLYRFLINKYCENKLFGGMLGYIVSDSPNVIVASIKSKIQSLKLTHHEVEFGNIIDSDLLGCSIQNIRYSFQSNHTRAHNNQLIAPIHMFHFFFDLTKV